MDGNGQRLGNGSDRDAKGKFALGNKASVGHKGPQRSDIGSVLRGIGDKKASTFGWSKKIAERMELDPDDYTVLDIIAHSAMEHGCDFGRAPYFTECIQRMFGKVPDQIQADINLGLTDEQKKRAQRIADLADAVE